MIVLKYTKTFEDCPNKCISISYLHDNQEEKTCCSCGQKWNRITNKKINKTQ